MGGPGSGRTYNNLDAFSTSVLRSDEDEALGPTWPDSELFFSPVRQFITEWRPEQREDLRRAQVALRRLGIALNERPVEEGGILKNQRHTWVRVSKMEIIRTLHVDRPISVDNVAALFMKDMPDTKFNQKHARTKALVALWKLKEEGLVKKAFTPEGRIAYQLTSTDAYDV
jgi:hypothetical protein